MDRNTHIGVHVHVGDDAFTCKLGNAEGCAPYYVLKVGDATLFIDAPRIADLLAVIQPVAEAETKPRKPVFHSLSACHGCGRSGDAFGSPHVEAFEVTGELYCEDCADGAIEQWNEDHREEAA